MAIVQISQIKHRHGVRSDLPQLATAELGWSVDTRQLYIGNGTLQEGAPEVGVTEILTQYSNLPNYTVYTLGLTADTTSNVTNAIATNNTPAIYIQYAIVRNNASRSGWLKLASNTANVAADYAIAFDEEYSDTSPPGTDMIGVTWGTVAVGTTGPNAYVQLTATVSNLSVFNANMQYTISTLSF
jgi:hypothetical protein